MNGQVADLQLKNLKKEHSMASTQDKLRAALTADTEFFQGKTLKQMHKDYCETYEYMGYEHFRTVVQRWKKAKGYKMNTGEGKTWEKSSKQ